MQCRIEEMRYKEVVNLSDGQRLGYVCDLEVDVITGQVVALVVPGPYRFFGLLGREDDYIIPWDCISRIGDDIILIDVKGEQKRSRKEKRGWYF